jgi:methyl-accepting chemotaxis protein
MNNMSLGLKQVLRNSIPVFVMLSILCAVMLVMLNGNANKRFEQIRADQMQAIDNSLAARIDMAITMVENMHATGATEEETKEAVKLLRFGPEDKDYIWIQTFDPANVEKPVMVMHPTNPSLDGQDLTGFVDKTKFEKLVFEGRKYSNDAPEVAHIEETRLFVEMNKVCDSTEGSGIVHYYWPKPGAEADVGYLKSSYVELFKPWGWILGTGAYADEVDQIVIASQTEERKASGILVSWFVGIVVTTLVLVVLVNVLSGRSLSGQLREVVSATNAMAQGDFTIQIHEARSGDEIGQMMTAFRKMKDSTAELVKQVSDSAANIASSSQELSAGADETSRAVEEVAETVTQVAKGSEQTTESMTHAQESMNQNAAAIEGISKDIEDVANFATQAASQGEEGRASADEAVGIINRAADSVQETAGVVKSLGDKTDQIGQFISIITGIADQTNLLALNAAIEAARAGEAGRGFAVVAEEVRKLAEESNQAAGNITGLVKGIEAEMGSALSAMERSDLEVTEGARTVSQASSKLGEIVEGVQALNDKVQNISAASQQITASTSMVVELIQSVGAVAEQNSAATQQVSSATTQQNASMEEINSNAADLADLATKMQELVSRFSV